MIVMRNFFFRLLIIILFQIRVIPAFAQTDCSVSHLPPSDKQLLMNFWNDFRLALNIKDTQKFAQLCSFPFPTNYKGKIKSSSNFTELAKIFFKDELIARINGHPLPESILIVHGDYREKHRGCVYDFYYETKSKEIHFDLTKVDNGYKITSSWQ